MHSYYMKGKLIQDVCSTPDMSVFFKKILKCKDFVLHSGKCEHIMGGEGFDTKLVYGMIRLSLNVVEWKELVANNRTMPKAKFCIWFGIVGFGLQRISWPGSVLVLTLTVCCVMLVRKLRIICC